MNVKQIFDLGLKMGINSDARGPKGVQEYLDRAKKELADCKPKDKEYFDQERLTNPYSDSRIHVNDGKKQVKRVMAGIDIGEAELLLASQLGESERKTPIDLVMAHHPVGKSLAGLHSVMDMQIDIFVKNGVPVHVAEKLMEKRISEVGRSVHPANHYRLLDVAKLLKVNLINTHTFTDNLVSDYLNNYLYKKDPKIVSDLIEALLEIPEYKEARKRGAGPSLFAGDMHHRVGKFMVGMTGGTSPHDDIFKELSNYGISTTVDMHMKDKARDNAVESNMNVIIAGHYASDSLGMNLYLDELEKKGIEVLPVGGLIRFSRVKKK